MSALLLTLAGLPAEAGPLAGEAGDLPMSQVVQEKVQAEPLAVLDLVVTYATQPGAFQRSRVELLGGSVEHSWARIKAQAVRLPSSAVSELADDPNVVWVSLDAPVTNGLESAPGSHDATPAGVVLGDLAGAGVTVAVIDSGFSTHPDIEGRVLAAVDFTGSSDAGDRWGHGTHVAGLIAGDGTASGGLYRGVAPAASLVHLRVLDETGSGTTSDVISALDWVIDHRAEFNIGVVNLSLGHPVFEPAALDPLVQAAELAWEAGVVVVCSAGNGGETGFFTVTSPGNSSRVITVGALTRGPAGGPDADRVSPFSAKGPTPFDLFVKPDLIAAGEGIVSDRAPGSVLDTLHANRQVTALGASEPEYFQLSGTGSATATVAGTVAAVLSEKDPLPNPDTVKALLMGSAEAVAGLPYETGSGALAVAAVFSETGWTSRSPSPRVFVGDDGGITVEETALTWSNEAWSTSALWGESADWSRPFLGTE